MRDRLALVLHGVNVQLAELRKLVTTGPLFRIVHRFREPGTVCLPGEEIAVVVLVHKGREYPLLLPLALRILFDYLAKHRGLPQSAAQIEAGLRSDSFYVRHGANAGRRQTQIGRASCRERV